MTNNTIMFIIQLIIGAFDGGSPPRFSANNVTVTINVVRNMFTPFFNDQQYAIEITQSLAINSFVGLTVQATDQDPNFFRTITFSIIGDGQLAPLFFDVDSSGRITVKQDLALSSESVLYVSFFSFDLR